ncbi:MAG: hypothetical protein SFZ24_03670 [Planctomycetota bacterium]|nr:hypothetical protein [Planctomycetota bacterium]
MRRACFILGGVIASGLVVAARGAEPSEAPALLTPVDEGHADRSPLSASLLAKTPDLRLAADFESVYRVPGMADRLMRIDGALAAVFPESEYVPWQGREVALIPAGTTWVIGVPTEESAARRGQDGGGGGGGGGGDPAQAGCSSGPVALRPPWAQPAERVRPEAVSPLQAVRPRSAARERQKLELEMVSRGLLPAPASPVAMPAEVTLAGQRVETQAGAPRVEPATVAIAAATVERAAPSEARRSRPADMTDEAYRAARLRSIARRYGPAGE